MRISELSKAVEDLCNGQHLQRQQFEQQQASQQAPRPNYPSQGAYPSVAPVQNSLPQSQPQQPFPQYPPQSQQFPSQQFPSQFLRPPAPGGGYANPAPPQPGMQYTYQHTTGMAPQPAAGSGAVVGAVVGSDEVASKVRRLVEMGFRREDALEQLQRHALDEHAALNALLGL